MGQWLIADLSVSGCSLPALDAAGHWLYPALVCLRLGDAVTLRGAGSEFLSLKIGSAGGDPISGEDAHFRCAAQTG